jgi:hypothetical protein
MKKKKFKITRKDIADTAKRIGSSQQEVSAVIDVLKKIHRLAKQSHKKREERIKILNEIDRLKKILDVCDITFCDGWRA